MHCAAAQATAHKTINAGCVAHSATFGVATATQTDEELGSSLPRLCAEAKQAWKDANEVIFSHLLKYDTQLAAFISTAEGTLQAKHDEIMRRIHSLADTANIPHRICLPLALLTLDSMEPQLLCRHSPDVGLWPRVIQLPDLEYLLDNDARATNLLSSKLVHMADGAGPDNPNPIRAASPAGSAVAPSQAHSPSRSCSRTPICETEKERSHSSSASSTHSQETKPESLVTSDSEVGNNNDSASQEGNESEETDEVDSDIGVRDDSEDSDGDGSDEEGSDGGNQWLMARMKTLMGKPMNPAVRLKGQMLKAAPTLQNPMMKLRPKQPHLQRRPQEATPTPPRLFYWPTWIARTLRRNGKFSNTKMPAS